jgi:hypothetical protein
MAIAMVLALLDEHDNRYPPEHWLKREEEAWEKALAFTDPEAKYQLQNIAMLYEEIAAYSRWRLLDHRSEEDA